MSAKAIIIAGPTASGKTDLALQLTEVIPADLLSSDSRQVYKGLDIIPGKDIPLDFTKTSTTLSGLGDVYQNKQTSIYGHDLIKPDQDWSVSHFYKYAKKAIKEISKQNRVPIIVGGTGLYQKVIYSPPASLFTKPDPKQRKHLETLSVAQLQETLKKTNPERFDRLNQSDRFNPRRLIRAIELAFASNRIKPPLPLVAKKNLLLILLTPSRSVIQNNIQLRVIKRFKQNWSDELDYLASFNLPFSAPATTIIGYSLLQKYRQKEISKEELITNWSTAERQYAKRQLTWYKKQTQFEHFDPTVSNTYTHIVEKVASWYHGSK